MKNTKIIATTAAAALALAGLSACSNDDATDGTATETSSVEATESETVTNTVTPSDEASADSQDGATTGAGINQTELDEWAKDVLGLGLTQQFGDAAEDPNAPTAGASVRAVTVEDGTLFLTTNLNTEANEGLGDASTLATLFGDALKNNPPAWGDKINKLVVQDQAQTPIKEQDVK
ncbi:hypothetical protein [Corynebacterium aquatimens]|uniref:Lipoprotein n=1 Tax=Corynebacterium aquatimens TaxID=1190508 RepID=A0A931E062_9CORY|nr:hypothetical protein [Corynebacterium aquatimens]MBG6121432.1 hypothetical protein [Corynebacterium aquatimens]WJY66024.1 hypothetical protein CAQUA_06615 [Corynebacterium aquatimens]